MDSIFSFLAGGGSVPEGVPPALAMSIAMYGYSETEARAIMTDCGDGAVADEWIGKLKQAGFFNSCCPTLEQPQTATSQSENSEVDAGTLLWKRILEGLRKDENGFKHQVMVLDNCIKNTGGPQCQELHLLAHQKAGKSIPFSFVQDNCPWNGCKFAGISVMHLISGTTTEAKRDACRTASRSLGGCTLPPNLDDIRWPYSLSEAFQEAALSVEDHSTALFVNVSDVEVMRHPAKRHGSRFIQRPGTFAHVFVMTISKAGVYLYQAYGPRGYTLLQYMENHDKDFPLSLAEGKLWVEQFEVFATNLCGIWSKEASEAYTRCFDVDLVKLGCMKVGSQMDVYVQVEEHVLDARTVQNNFDMLPQPDASSYPPCVDGVIAQAKKPPKGYIPDGGVPHYYVPLVTRCGHCGKPSPPHGKHDQCSRCKKVCYCSRECQVADWKLRHKKDCQQLATISLRK